MDANQMFPRASSSFKAANPQLFEPPPHHDDKHLPALVGGKVKSKLRTAPEPNKTEREFGLFLEALKAKGEIVRYDFQGFALMWLGMRYKADWSVWRNSTAGRPLLLIEVKGPKIWDRDIVRFKGARAYWPQIDFEMWQKKEGTWNRLL